MSPPESGRLRWCFTFALAGQEEPTRGKGPGARRTGGARGKAPRTGRTRGKISEVAAGAGEEAAKF